MNNFNIPKAPDKGNILPQSGACGVIPHKAHQRIIREKFQVEDAFNLFGNWWEKIDKSPNKTIVKEVERNSVEPIISKYEWLGNIPDNANRFVALFFEGKIMGGALAFSYQFFGGKYKLFGQPAIALCRGVTLHYSPSWVSSYLIQNGLKLLFSNADPVFIIGFTDFRAGEIGTIYQACGWYYLGHKRTREWISPEGIRKDASFHKIRVVSGSRHRRTGRKATKEQYEQEAKKMIEEGWIIDKSVFRGRYATVAGKKGKEYRYMIKLLEKHSKPYPKRAGQDSRESRHTASVEGGVRFPGSAQN